MTATRWTCWSCISERTFPGCVVRGRPIGVLDMSDDKGHDYKVLAVAHDDPRWDGTDALEQISPHLLREIENFFDTYKALEGRQTHVSGWLGAGGRVAHHRLRQRGRAPGDGLRGRARQPRHLALRSPQDRLEGLQVALDLPGGHLHPVLVPLLGLGLDEALEDVLARAPRR